MFLKINEYLKCCECQNVCMSFLPQLSCLLVKEVVKNEGKRKKIDEERLELSIEKLFLLELH